MPTVTSVDAWGLVEPYLVRYNGNGSPMSVDDPLATITAKDRFGLVIPTADGEAIIDIRFRMLQPHELAAAMSFPSGYQFSGNREQRVKQIGNAVPVRTAQALCESLIG
jgi:DNA (cytosine-5)-methyltransferase 1